MSQLILSLDIGTSSTRALLYDADQGSLVEGSAFAIAHQPRTTTAGEATLDADRIVEEVVVCAAEALAHAAGQPIIGVAVCTFWHSFVGVDAAGTALTPILLWSDTRSAGQVARLRDLLDPDAYTQCTGCPLHTSFLPGRLLWLRENNPVAFAASTRFLSPGEYLFARLFGLERVTCSASMASASGLLDQRTQQWDPVTLGILGLEPSRFSALGEGAVSGLLPLYRARLPELADIPWFPAAGDGACSSVGCGATVPERLALMVGTSGAMRVAVSGSVPPPVPAGLWRYQFGPGRFLLGGALSNGGLVWAWLKRTLRLPGPTDDDTEAAIAALPPDGHGLTVLPFLAGERAPLWQDGLRASIHGLSAATTPVEIAQAHLEAVAYRFLWLRSALRPVAPKAELIGTGAALLASRVWAQIVTDTLCEPLHLSPVEEASSRGAALLVRERLGLGTITDVPPPPPVTTLYPNLGRTAIYGAAAVRQEEKMGGGSFL